MSDYPLVEIPPALTAALGAVPPPLVPPTYVPLPTYPSRPGLFTLQWAAWALFLGLIAVWLLAQDLTGGAGFLAVGSALAGWWAEARAGRRHERAVGAFHADFSQHQAYPALQQQYARALADQSHPEAVAQYRAWRVAQVLAGVTLPFRPVPATEFTPPQGRSEAAFLHYLQQNFGVNTIFIKRRVRVDDLGPGTDWFYPDVVYRDESGLCINLEIDEPYVWTTGEPHHYLGKDEARNAFFLRKNWAVLRFTEEQVVRAPLACCQVLAALIFHLTGRHYPARQYSGRPVPQPQWDWVEAKRLAASRSRDAYQDARLVGAAAHGKAKG